MKVWPAFLTLLALGGCDLFDTGPEIYTTVVEGVAVRTGIDPSLPHGVLRTD